MTLPQNEFVKRRDLYELRDVMGHRIDALVATVDELTKSVEKITTILEKAILGR